MESSYQHISRQTHLVFVQIVWQPTNEDLVGRIGNDSADYSQNWSIDRNGVSHAWHWLIIVWTTDLQTLSFEVNS